MNVLCSSWDFNYKFYGFLKLGFCLADMDVL